MIKSSLYKQMMLAVTIILMISFGINLVVSYYAIKRYETFTLSLSEELLTDVYKQELQSTTEMAASLLQTIYQRDDLSEDEKLTMAREVIQPLRFGTDGYYFAYEVGTGVNKIHGGKPELNDQNFWDLQDQEGQYFIRELDRVAQEGTLFSKWYYPKAGGSLNEAYPKLGTAKLVPEANMWIGTGAYIDSIEARQGEIIGDIQSITRVATGLSFGTFTILLVGCLFVVSFIAKKLIDPIKSISLIANKIAEGDLHHEIEIDQANEIGQLARAFRQMVSYLQQMAGAADRLAQGDLTAKVTPKSHKDALGNALSTMIANLRQLIGQVIDTATTVDTTSNQLSANTEQASEATHQISVMMQQLAAGAQQQSDSALHTKTSVDQVARAIDGVAQGAQEQAAAIAKSSDIANQMERAIQQVATNAQAGVDDASKASQTARQGVNIVGDTIQGMQTIKSKVDLSAQRVQEMGQRSQQIGAIVQTIEDIASQTNLLALNAAIEAARAGEHGKGFAVVADEVRKLAEKSALATKEIAGLIQTIQETVAEAVTAMEDGTNEVESGVGRANEAGQILSDILRAVEAADDQVKSILVATQQMRVSSDELVSTMERVSAVVEENSAAAEEMAASSNEVAQAVDNVARVSDENSAAVESVSAASEEMSAQVYEVRESAQNLNVMAQNLKTIVSRFKLNTSRADIIDTNGYRPDQAGQALPEPFIAHGEAYLN
ncbi:MAG: methyl-accepting chemotaxis protein [Anaerolineae bacterium]|nr:methyl-accepting chemotaxis protein [Anaerolineae bacterium]